MPSRLLREGIIDSEAVNALSWGAEVFYRRLMSVVDDFGRFDGRLSLLRSRLYPTCPDRAGDADMRKWISECEKAGLILVYTVESKPFILFHKLGQPRAKVSKFPPPPPTDCQITSVNGCAQTQTDANVCAQTRAYVPYSYSGSGSDSGTYSDSSSGADAPASDVKPKKPRKKKPTGPHAEFVDAFCNAWEARYGERYPFSGGKDGDAIAWLREQLNQDVSRFKRVLERYFADKDPFVVEKQRHSLGYLRSQLHKWISDGPVAAKPAKDEYWSQPTFEDLDYDCGDTEQE